MKSAGEETELLKAIRQGKSVVFKGQFSETLAKRLQSVFTPNPSLFVNGEHIPITGSLSFMSNDGTPFTEVVAQTFAYHPEDDLKRLEIPLQEKLKALFTELAITPCHSYFIDLPQDKSQHEHWFQTLSARLCAAAGQVLKKETTTPHEILDELDTCPLLFLVSETGEGKSYFVNNVLPEYGAITGHPIHIYHGIDSIKAWAESGGDPKPILFLDEANLVANHYTLFENLARGERVLWLDGKSYPLSPHHKVILAGNPKAYEGRFDADLFRRFPFYMSFKGQPLAPILQPLLDCFEDKHLLPIIEDYYQKAQATGLNITPRNAQMMCLTAFALKQLPNAHFLPEDLLLSYAALQQIEMLGAEARQLQTLQPSLETWPEWDIMKKAIEEQWPKTTSQDFIWTSSRRKIALVIQTFLSVRQQKINHPSLQAMGINGLALEGEPGLGKSRLLISLLEAQQIPYIIINTSNPETMRQQLTEAFHQGQVVIINELNSFPDEECLNALLSGTDLDGKKAEKPGFAVLSTQNPITFANREALSKALGNRLIKLNLNHYSNKELAHILQEKFKLPTEKADELTFQYSQSLDFAKKQRLFPPPNPRTLFKAAKHDIDSDESKPKRKK